MHCICCGEASAFDRLVVRLRDRVEIGFLCETCEEKRSSLFESSGKGNSTCRLCDREGSYSLPQWDIVAWDDRGEELRWLEYELDPEAVLLCEDHLEGLMRETGGRNRSDEPRFLTRVEAVTPP